MRSFYFRELQLITGYHITYILWFLYLLMQKAVSRKLCVGFSIFNSVLFLVKNNTKATHSFSPRPLIYKLQHKIFKIQW